VSKNKNLPVYELIHSLSKNEKRYFSLLIGNSGNAEDKKVVKLFNHLNKVDEYDESKLLKQVPEIKAEQLANQKAYLYQKILQALRLYNSPKIIDLQIREQIDFAQILFERRLYSQGLSALKKARKLASLQENLEQQLEILKMERGVLLQTIGPDLEERVDALIADVRLLSQRINNIQTFANLSIKLNSFYTRLGFIRDEQDYTRVKEYFYNNLPAYEEEDLSLSEKIHLYRLFAGYFLFTQDFENGYLFAHKLVQLFDENPHIINSSLEAYIKALNQLLIVQHRLFRYVEFVQTNRKLHSISRNPSFHINESMRITLLKYYYMHEINRYFMTGRFDEGLTKVVDEQQKELNELIDLLDLHSSLVLTYKVACMYLGASNYKMTIKWLNRIVNQPVVDIREDIHSFARIINLICHYELGNYDIINHYIISTYRFLLKKDDLHLFQKFILNFLKNLSTEVEDQDLMERFEKLKSQMLLLVNSAYEKRAFIYFDIISWLESKIEKRPVQDIIQQKANDKFGRKLTK